MNDGLPQISAQETDALRCLRCRSFNLVRSGKEVYRHECLDCGQHYFVVMQLVPVANPKPSPLLEIPVAEPCSRTR
jgi:hypothetical protein